MSAAAKIIIAWIFGVILGYALALSPTNPLRGIDSTIRDADRLRWSGQVVIIRASTAISATVFAGSNIKQLEAK